MVSITSKQVGPIGFGMMGEFASFTHSSSSPPTNGSPGLTFRPKLPPQEQSFSALKAALASGANFWNGGEIYGSPSHNSLHLLNEYFTKYPEDSDKVVISIKGGYTPGGILGGQVDGSPTNIKRSIDECLKVLDGKKFLDVFECARVDPKTPIEETMDAINKYIEAGKLGGVALSEVSAQTIRRAAKVANIVVVEVEVSLWSMDIFENGVAKACADLGIPIVAYSPIGRGFLVSNMRSLVVAESDMKLLDRRHQIPIRYP
jgi:pyridoxine 4-dehydrogenase